MDKLQIITIVLGSSVLVALVTVIGNVTMFILNRKAQKQDKKEEKEDTTKSEIKEINKKLDIVIKSQETLQERDESMASNIKNLTEGQMLLLKKEIEREASKHISVGHISITCKEEMHKMHDVYHNKLGGNGGLNSIMDSIDQLKIVTD